MTEGGDHFEAERPKWWTKAEACKHLGISIQSLNAYIRSGAVNEYGRGPQKRVRVEEVKAEYRARRLRKRDSRFGHSEE